MLKSFPVYRRGSRQEFRKVRCGKYNAGRFFLQEKNYFSGISLHQILFILVARRFIRSLVLVSGLTCPKRPFRNSLVYGPDLGSTLNLPGSFHAFEGVRFYSAYYNHVSVSLQRFGINNPFRVTD